jgi:YD repeat-containing protein
MKLHFNHLTVAMPRSNTETYTYGAYQRLTSNPDGQQTSGVTYNAANQITAATIPSRDETRSLFAAS